MDIFDTALEVEFLRTIILESDLIYDVKPKIRAEMFSNTPHQVIYRCLEDLADANIGISRDILVSKLKDKEKLNAAGGPAYIDEILSGRPNPKGIKEHVKNIQNSYKTRALFEINSKIPDILDNPAKVDNVITRLNKQLDSLVSSTGYEHTVALGDAIDDAIENIKERANSDQLPGIETGFSDIDYTTAGLMKGDLWYIGARPSMGKSAWLIKAFLNIASNGIPVLLFSQEMSRNQIIDRIISIETGIDHQSIRLGTVKDSEIQKIEEVRETIKNLPLYIDSSFGITIDEAVGIIRKYKQLHNIQVVGIDYIQIIVERTGDQTAELGRASRILKLLSNELEITTIVLSQLNRDVEKRDNKRPIMSDLRQSGNLEEDADVMAALYRDEVYVDNSPDQGLVEFIIRKARNGPIGTVVFRFDKETVNMYDR